jgi:ring-1,2-phenylacetyl-CoA epoxidase subunit PaaE
VRPDLPFVCEGVVRGMYRALLMNGQASMQRNFALEPAELDAGYVSTHASAGHDVSRHRGLPLRL